MAKRKPCCGRGVHPEGIAYELIHSKSYVSYGSESWYIHTFGPGWTYTTDYCLCEKGRLLRKKDEITKLIKGE